MTVFDRRQYNGAAVKTALTGSLSSAATTMPIGSSTGWPDGSVGNFLVTVNRGNATEEQILCSARSGTTLTVAASGRGYNSTAASAHITGESVEHTLGATDLDEANQAVHATLGAVAAKGDLLVGSAVNTLGRVAVGSNGQVLTVDSTQTTGTKWATTVFPTALLARTVYNPATSVLPTVTGVTLAAFDSANMTVSFTTAASGLGSTAVLVRVSSTCVTAGSGTVGYWALGAHGSTTDIQHTLCPVVNSATLGSVSRDWVITGLSPSTALQYDLLGAGDLAGHSVSVLAGISSPYGPFIMEVWAA